MITLNTVRRRLVAHSPRLLPAGSGGRAAVALVLLDAAERPEVLFIERARWDGDPWSGHLAFPGGSVEPADPGPRATAERETAEEIGLDLAEGEYLGRLDDFMGAYLPVVVSCFVYRLGHRPALTLNDEVAQAFWFPLAGLLDPARRGQVFHTVEGREVGHPAIRLLGPGLPLLWGLTYRMVGGFLEVLGCPLPKGRNREPPQP